MSSTSRRRKASCRPKMSACWNWGYFLRRRSARQQRQQRDSLLELDDVHGGGERRYQAVQRERAARNSKQPSSVAVGGNEGRRWCLMAMTTTTTTTTTTTRGRRGTCAPPHITTSAIAQPCGTAVQAIRLSHGTRHSGALQHAFHLHVMFRFHRQRIILGWQNRNACGTCPVVRSSASPPGKGESCCGGRSTLRRAQSIYYVAVVLVWLRSA